jgi:hypothetical protein
MATIKTKKDWTHTEEQEQAVVDPDYDEASDPDYEAGADPDYNDDFRDPEAEESSQEWRYRPQR